MSPGRSGSRPRSWYRIAWVSPSSSFRARSLCERPGMAATLPLGVAGPGPDDAILAAELVAFARRLVQRSQTLRPDRIAVRPARVRHVDGKRRAGALHGDRLATAALALPERRDPRRALGGIVISPAIGAAFADRKGAGGPRLRHEMRGAHD